MIIKVRNGLFDKNILKSTAFNFPIINVGNLAVGGTGKTPMTELIVSLLKNDFNIAILSRGYKRRTKGFAIANETTTALEIGDEPMQFHQKFPDVTVAVGEERLVAIPQILFQQPETQLIILDDAFQHRRVQPGLNIVLTDCNNLFTRDVMFPVGDLRDVRSSIKRADIIVVTKCDEKFSLINANDIQKEIKPLMHQKLFFTSIKYGKPYHLFSGENIILHSNLDVLLLVGIANPLPIKKYIHQESKYYEMIKYADHHIFSTGDLSDIISQFNRLENENKIILTTEKDAVRLQKYQSELSGFPIYVLPIEHQFLFDSQDEFLDCLKSFVVKFSY
jgi:tetraacyldisaccharide 4'-kinase